MKIFPPIVSRNFLLLAVCLPAFSALSSLDLLQIGTLEGQKTNEGNWEGDADFQVEQDSQGNKMIVSETRERGLGAVLFTPANDSSGDVFTVEVELEMLESPVGTDDNAQTVFALQLGYAGEDEATGSRIYIRSDGRLGYNKGGQPGALVPNLSLAGKGDVVSIQVKLDYATQKYWLTVNDTPVGDVERGIGFRGNTSSRVVRFVNIGSPSHRMVAVRKFQTQ